MYNYIIHIFQINQIMTQCFRNADLGANKAIGNGVTLTLETNHETVDFDKIMLAGRRLIRSCEVACFAIIQAELEQNIVKYTGRPIRHPDIWEISNGKSCCFIKLGMDEINMDIEE